MSSLRAHQYQIPIESPVANPANITLRRLEVEDLGGVTRVHMAAFPKSALTLLGPEAVRRYYQWQLQGPHDVTASGAFMGNQLIGFSFSGVFCGATGGFLKQNRKFLAVRLLTHPWLVANPLIRERMNFSARVLRRKNGRGDQTTSRAKEKIRSFGILAIAVDPQVQSSGIGGLLMATAEQVAITQGFTQMHLTVNPNNNQAIKFYEKLSWEKTLTQGEWTGSMKKALKS